MLLPVNRYAYDCFAWSLRLGPGICTIIKRATCISTVEPITTDPKLKETTGGEFRVYRASLRLLKGI